MGYTKLIKSGDIIELYQYEKDLPKQSRIRIKRRVKGLTVRVLRSFANVQRQRKSFYRLVRANIGREESPALVTLTMYQSVGITSAYQFVTAFFARLRREFGPKIRYIGVPEFQKDVDFYGKKKRLGGSVHFHVLMWGLPDWIYEERKTRFMQSRWLFGFCDLTRTDGSVKLAGYLAKYMQKGVLDERLCGQKGYFSSRNVLRPVCLSTPTQVSYSDEVLGLSTDYHIDTVYEFPTQWLGKCVYKNYKVNS